jgi:hypothetical protein
MRITVAVREPMMLAMVRHPADHRALNRHHPRYGEGDTEPLLSPERVVCEHAVKADRHAVAGEEIHRDGDDHIPPREAPTPQHWHGGDKRHKG